MTKGDLLALATKIRGGKATDQEILAFLDDLNTHHLTALLSLLKEVLPTKHSHA